MSMREPLLCARGRHHWHGSRPGRIIHIAHAACCYCGKWEAMDLKCWPWRTTIGDWIVRRSR